MQTPGQPQGRSASFQTRMTRPPTARQGTGVGRAPGDVLRARRGPSCVYEALIGRSILQQHVSLPTDPYAGSPRRPRLARIRGAPEPGWVPLTSPRSLGTPSPPSGDHIPRHLPARRALLAAFRQSHDLMEQLFLSPPPAASSRPGGERSPARGSQSHRCAADRPCGSLGRWGSPQWWREGGLVPTGCITGAEGCEGG